MSAHRYKAPSNCYVLSHQGHDTGEQQSKVADFKKKSKGKEHIAKLHSFWNSLQDLQKLLPVSLCGYGRQNSKLL